MSQKLNAAIAVIGIDIGKNSFHLVGHDPRGAIVLRQKWSRGQVEARLANLPPCLIGMEACVGAHHLSRRLQMLGHDARLMPAKYARPYSKGQKNDFRDAEAIAEAVQRPTMKFVATKTADQLDLQALHRVRDRLVGQRTGVINQIRAFLLERGVDVRQGLHSLRSELLGMRLCLGMRLLTAPSERPSVAGILGRPMELKRSRLFEQVADVLEQRIRDRELVAGAELPSERQLMAEYGVGRTAIREALFHLQRAGFVDLRAGSRARVAAPNAEVVMTSLSSSAKYLLSDDNGIRHFQDARALFETGLARDAARNATPKDLRLLGDALDANYKSIGDIRRFEDSDVAFHYAIATIPKNPIYVVMHRAIIDWLVDQRRVTLSYPGQNRVAFDAHVAIFEAIKAHDPELADARMRSHLGQVAKLYWKARRAAK